MIKRFTIVGVCFLSLLAAKTVLANGWEHGAVPFEALTDGLASGDAPTREKAAHSLGFRGQDEAVPHLLAALEKPEENRDVRRSIYTSLGQLGDKRGQAPLTSCLETEAREEIRAICALALGSLAGFDDNALLIGLAKADASKLVRRRAIAALGKLGNADATAALSEIALSDDAKADTGLWQGTVAALGETQSPEAGRFLAKQLATTTVDHKQFVLITALIRAPASSAVEPLQKIIQGDGPEQIRAAATIALASAKSDGSEAFLTDLLKDRSKLVQFQVLGLLQRSGSPEPANAINTYALALAQRLAAASKDDLLARLGDSREDLLLLETALRALTETDPVAGLPAYLLAATQDPDVSGSTQALTLKAAFYSVRRAALYGMGYTKSSQAVALLEGNKGVGDDDPRLRAVAARSLGVLENERSAAVLIPLLKDRSAEVRWTTAGVLGALGDRQAVTPLVTTLEDRDARVRAAAAEALAYLHDHSVIAKLRVLKENDADPKVRATAGFALQRLEH